KRLDQPVECLTVIVQHNVILVFWKVNITQIQPSKFDRSELGLAEIHTLHFIRWQSFFPERILVEAHLIQLSFERAIDKCAARKVDLLQPSIPEHTCNEFSGGVRSTPEVRFRKVDMPI